MIKILRFEDWCSTWSKATDNIDCSITTTILLEHCKFNITRVTKASTIKNASYIFDKVRLKKSKLLLAKHVGRSFSVKAGRVCKAFCNRQNPQSPTRGAKTAKIAVPPLWAVPPSRRSTSHTCLVHCWRCLTVMASKLSDGLGNVKCNSMCALIPHLGTDSHRVSKWPK